MLAAAITGITVHERITDKFSERTGQIELIDIEPKEFMERLRSGKIPHYLHISKPMLE